MDGAKIILALIVVIVILVLAWFAYRRESRPAAARFGLGAPATPLVRDALVALGARLAGLSQTAAAFAQTAESAGSTCARAGAGEVAAVERAVAATVAPLESARLRIAAMPPTYANVFSLYRGLSDSDGSLLGAARAFERAGHDIHQRLAQKTYGGGPPAGQRAHECQLGLADAGNALQKTGSHIRQVVAAVHNLGVALDAE